LTQPAKENIIPTTRRGAPQGGRHQIGTPAGFGSEQVAGFRLECMAGFVGIRISRDGGDGACVERAAGCLQQPRHLDSGPPALALELGNTPIMSSPC
jgi:hypothetical protein